MADQAPEAAPPVDDDLYEMYARLGLSREEVDRMLASMRKKDEANRKRAETLRRKKEAKEAERLAKPPVDHEDAYWRHVNTCPFPPYSDERKAWLKENPRFAFDGTLWVRHATPMRSNSGKSIVGWNKSYHGDDGRVVHDRLPPNRRNDADRNWGLPE